MALVSINDAAKLVRKTRTTLFRDIEKGRLKQTVLQDGDIRIDTTELLRAYGRLENPEAPQKKTERNNDKTKIAVLEERNRALERVIGLEGELRRAKAQMANELRAQLAEKDRVIKTLENKILFMDYDRQLQNVPTLDLRDREPDAGKSGSGNTAGKWWVRMFRSGGARGKKNMH